MQKLNESDVDCKRKQIFTLFDVIKVHYVLMPQMSVCRGLWFVCIAFGDFVISYFFYYEDKC